jgi:hypothetical protein
LDAKVLKLFNRLNAFIKNEDSKVSFFNRNIKNYVESLKKSIKIIGKYSNVL